MQIRKSGARSIGPASHVVVALLAACGLFAAAAAGAAEASDTATTGSSDADAAKELASLTDRSEAAEGDGDVPRRRLVSWNEYEGPYFTARLGGGFLYDYVDYDQDADSKQQMSLSGKGMVRDARFLLKGGFPKIPGLTYTIGYMYDVADESWKWRQTGLQYQIPGTQQRVFVGRTKEGISTSKLMVGYQGWTNERATANDAFLPILADGIKWMGLAFDERLYYSVGWFGDEYSEKENFNRSDNQVVFRAAWRPFLVSDPQRLLHLGVAWRHASADDGQLRMRSKPESFPAQSYAIDTGLFDAKGSDILAIEAYYRPGPLMFGMEYLLNQIDSAAAGDPFIHGGEIFAAYTITGEVKPYNTASSTFERISPERTVFEGGPGAWEAVLRFSYSDFDSGVIQGGKFWRITPMVNWHMSDNVRLELVYGYGVLDRFDLKGATHFFQSRIQLQL